MMELGKKQTLRVLRKKEIGVYLGEGGSMEQGVLLPRKQVPDGIKVGDELEVFLYKDSEDRLIATVREPLLAIGELGLLTVVQAGSIGAFLDWGLERDLFLPFKEQKWKVRKGEKVLVSLYTDKSRRLCATMKIDKYLSADSPYKKDDEVKGILYEINRSIGGFVAVDRKYFGLIPAGELERDMIPGTELEARVSRVREDGKLVLSARKKAYKQMSIDAESVYELIESYNGILPFTDKSAPELIRLETGLTKNAFKRAVGHLLKEGKIQIKTDTIELTGGK
ncbi:MULTISPECIES: CvfB family protein [unclassified Candidatus Paralachnospira]|uniref:CvfB family protein n=1 Tax=unclassified Candidatus Paralachnospira TaxID=3099471 RepID=UPI003F8E3285